MSAKNETLSRVLTVALGLCIVCSVVVSTAAVALKPQQAVRAIRQLTNQMVNMSATPGHHGKVIQPLAALKAQVSATTEPRSFI